MVHVAGNNWREADGELNSPLDGNLSKKSVQISTADFIILLGSIEIHSFGHSSVFRSPHHHHPTVSAPKNIQQLLEREREWSEERETVREGRDGFFNICSSAKWVGLFLLVWREEELPDIVFSQSS